MITVIILMGAYISIFPNPLKAVADMEAQTDGQTDYLASSMLTISKSVWLCETKQTDTETSKNQKASLCHELAT